MSNKPYSELSDIDKRLRALFPTEMWENDETIVTIRMFGGFELFNTRPYHNYENWSKGYEITTGKRYGNIQVYAEDLDDAVTELEREMKKPQENPETKMWHDMKLIRISDVGKDFKYWLAGQTLPYVKDDDDPMDWAYFWDYERFVKGLPITD